jgi:D-glycero-alpha-D-manno-heptose 1-phosphate guanylyltransferase
MRAILLAGGFGTRLRSVVSDAPKPMAPVAGRPFLFWLLDLLASRGVSEAVIAVGYMRQAIIDAVGDRYGSIAIRYAIEETPLGTGGGLRNALAMANGFPAFALNADTMLDLDYREMLENHKRAGARLSIAVRSAPDAGRYGRAIVEDGRLRAFAADGAPGPGLINAGVYLFSENLLVDPALPDAFSWERDFLPSRLELLRPLAFVADGYFIDIGVPDDYRRAREELPRMAVRRDGRSPEARD